MDSFVILFVCDGQIECSLCLCVAYKFLILSLCHGHISNYIIILKAHGIASPDYIRRFDTTVKYTNTVKTYNNSTILLYIYWGHVYIVAASPGCVNAPICSTHTKFPKFSSKLSSKTHLFFLIFTHNHIFKITTFS